MSDHWATKLSAYLDDELAPEDAAALEAHLTRCEECVTALGELRAVMAWADSYPGRAPATDVWPRISARLHHTRGGPVDLLNERSGRPPWLIGALPKALAAGIALMAVAGGGWLLGRASAPAVPALAVIPVAEMRGVPSTDVTMLQAEKYAAAIAELEMALSARTAGLDSGTVRILNEKLHVIDRAIADARRALASDPNSAYLAQHFTRMMRHKLILLRNAPRFTVTQG